MVGLSSLSLNFCLSKPVEIVENNKLNFKKFFFFQN